MYDGTYYLQLHSQGMRLTVRRIPCRCSNNPRIVHPAVQHSVQIDGFALDIENRLIPFAKQRLAVLVRYAQVDNVQ